MELGLRSMETRNENGITYSQASGYDESCDSGDSTYRSGQIPVMPDEYQFAYWQLYSN